MCTNYFREMLFCFCCYLLFPAKAQETAPFYEYIIPYAGLSFAKLQAVNVVPAVIFGFEGGGRLCKYDVQLCYTLSSGNSGARYLSAYSHTTPQSIEIPFDTKTGYGAVAFSCRYYLNNSETTQGVNYYAGVGTVMQLFTLTTTKGIYDPTAYYVQDEIYQHKEPNRAAGLALRFGGGCQYSFANRLTLFAEMSYDHRLFANGLFAKELFPKGNAFLVGIGVKYRFVLSD